MNDEATQQEKRFLRALCLTIFLIVTLSFIVHRAYALGDPWAVIFGASYALVTALFYGYLLKLLAGKSFSFFLASSVILAKLMLVIGLFLVLTKASDEKLWSGMLGFSTLLMAGLYTAFRAIKSEEKA